MAKKSAAKSKPAPPRAKPAPETEASGKWEHDKVKDAYVMRDDKPGLIGLAKETGWTRRTLEAWSAKEGWPRLRKEHFGRVSEGVRKNTEYKQIYDGTRRLQVIEGLLTKAIQGVQGGLVEAKSQEGLMREAREMVKTLALFDGEPTERIELSGEQRERLIAVFTRLKATAPDLYEEMKAIYGYESTGNV